MKPRHVQFVLTINHDLYERTVFMCVVTHDVLTNGIFGL